MPKITLYGMRKDKDRIMFTVKNDRIFRTWLYDFLEEMIKYSSLVDCTSKAEFSKWTPVDEHGTYGNNETKTRIDAFYGNKKAFVLVDTPNKRKAMNLITKNSKFVKFRKGKWKNGNRTRR